MSIRPLVSLITVNFNSAGETRDFLRSVKGLTYTAIEVIVVDNGSRESPSDLVEEFPFIHFIRSEINRGFAGGNNLGIASANGKYLFFLNNDTVLIPDFLEPIVSFMEANSNVGMASPKVLFPDEKTIQYAGAKAISPFTGRGKRLGLGETDHGQYDFCSPTDLGHGAALIVRKTVVDRIGPMPEEYFLYYEEHDWCEQAKRAGFLMYYIGTTRIIHKEAMSTGGGENPLKVYYLSRNRLLFMRRNSSPTTFAIGLTFFIFFSLPKNLAGYLVNGRLSLLRAYLKGIGWNILNWKSIR